jgi:hypothetical protein
MTSDDGDEPHDSGALKGLANNIAEPIKAKVSADIYDRLVERIHFAFEQARTKVVPRDQIEAITTEVMRPFADDIDAEALDIVTKRFRGGLTG